MVICSGTKRRSHDLGKNVSDRARRNNAEVVGLVFLIWRKHNWKKKVEISRADLASSIEGANVASLTSNAIPDTDLILQKQFLLVCSSLPFFTYFDPCAAISNCSAIPFTIAPVSEVTLIWSIGSRWVWWSKLTSCAHHIKPLFGADNSLLSRRAEDCSEKVLNISRN